MSPALDKSLNLTARISKSTTQSFDQVCLVCFFTTMAKKDIPEACMMLPMRSVIGEYSTSVGRWHCCCRYCCNRFIGGSWNWNWIDARIKVWTKWIIGRSPRDVKVSWRRLRCNGPSMKMRIKCVIIICHESLPIRLDQRQSQWIGRRFRGRCDRLQFRIHARHSSHCSSALIATVIARWSILMMLQWSR